LSLRSILRNTIGILSLVWEKIFNMTVFGNLVPSLVDMLLETTTEFRIKGHLLIISENTTELLTIGYDEREF